MGAVTLNDPVWTALSLVLAARGPGGFATVTDFAVFVVALEEEMGVQLEPGAVLLRWHSLGGFPPLQELEA